MPCYYCGKATCAKWCQGGSRAEAQPVATPVPCYCDEPACPRQGAVNPATVPAMRIADPLAAVEKGRAAIEGLPEGVRVKPGYNLRAEAKYREWPKELEWDSAAHQKALDKAREAVTFSPPIPIDKPYRDAAHAKAWGEAISAMQITAVSPTGERATIPLDALGDGVVMIDKRAKGIASINPDDYIFLAGDCGPKGEPWTIHAEPNEPKPPTLADFEKSVEEHLLPHLPGRLRVVSDARGGNIERRCASFVVAIVDETGRDVMTFERFGLLYAEEGEDIARDVAWELMKRNARGK